MFRDMQHERGVRLTDGAAPSAGADGAAPGRPV